MAAKQPPNHTPRDGCGLFRMQKHNETVTGPAKLVLESVLDIIIDLFNCIVWKVEVLSIDGDGATKVMADFRFQGYGPMEA
jgi:hypothetical protein